MIPVLVRRAFCSRTTTRPIQSFRVVTIDDLSNTTTTRIQNRFSTRSMTSALPTTSHHHEDDRQREEDRQQDNNNNNNESLEHQRVWTAHDDNNNNPTTTTSEQQQQQDSFHYWNERVADRYTSTQELLELELRIQAQEVKGGRLQKRQMGVLHQDPATDMQLLTDNYTVKAVASALRDREDALQYAAVLAQDEKWSALKEHLSLFHPKLVEERRVQKKAMMDISAQQQEPHHFLEMIRKALMRMPRTVTTAHSKRAAVVLALCTVQRVPCILLEKRSPHLRSHPDEVCLPGGLACDVQDRSIVDTCLREMKEEIGGLDQQPIDVLGVFRCNWGEIHHLVNVAVTPVVCFLGELPETLHPNYDEVAQVFTVPLASLIDKSMWIHREGLAPIFVGAHEVIWGLTGYILERFAKDILLPNSSQPSTLPTSITSAKNRDRHLRTNGIGAFESDCDGDEWQ